MNNIYEYKFPNEIKQLVLLISMYPKKWQQILRRQIKPKRYIDIDIDAIMYALNSIKDLDLQQYSLSTKAYWLLNGIVEHPRCKTCGKIMPYKNVKNIYDGYQHLHCSVSCGNSDKEVLSHIQQTSIQLYGTKNPAQSEAIKAKIKKHNLETYGVEWFTQSEKFKSQSKLTCIDKYGVDNIAKSEVGQQHMKQTCQQRYGVDNAMQCYAVFKKATQKYCYDEICFASKYEIAFYIWLKDKQINFEYQPNAKFNYVHNGKEHFYMPDFIVDGKYIEIKGDHFFKEDGTMQNPYDHSQDSLYEAKHQCMVENNVTIIRQKDCKQYIDYVESKYGKGYLSQFKKKSKESII